MSLQATSKFVLAALALCLLPYFAHAITVSPVRIELEGDPGQLVTGEFKIFNEQKDAQIFVTSFENFEARDESGSPSFVGGTSGLASWLSAPNEVEVGGGELAIVPFSIRIPSGAESGGHFAAVFLGTRPQGGDGSQVSISGKVGVLVLLRVSGPIEEGGALLEFDTRDQRRFYTALPVNFFYRFQNGGTDRVKPSGTILIKNWLGGITTELEANRGGGNVLPDSIRRFELAWQDEDAVIVPSTELTAGVGFFNNIKDQWHNFAMGRYTAKLNLVYGSDRKSVGSELDFWVFPWHLLLVVVVGLILIFIIFTSVLRRYNAWIIKRAQGASGL